MVLSLVMNFEYFNTFTFSNEKVMIWLTPGRISPIDYLLLQQTAAMCGGLKQHTFRIAGVLWDKNPNITYLGPLLLGPLWGCNQGVGSGCSLI